MKFLPSVAPIEQLLGDISKNIKSRDPTHLAHYLKQAANFNLGSRKLQTVDLYRKKRTLLAFKKKITHTHTHKHPNAHPAPFSSKPGCSRKKGKIQKNVLLGNTTLTKVSFLSLPSNLNERCTNAKKNHVNVSHYSNCSTTVKY